MINLFLCIIIAVFMACIHEKALKEKKRITKEEGDNRKVSFEQGERQMKYKIKIFHHVGLIELQVFSSQIYDSPEEVMNNCEEMMWRENGLDINMGKDQIYLPWESVDQIKMTIEKEMKK